MVIYYEAESGDQFKLSIVKDDEKSMDFILDQLNIGKFKFITEDQFNIADPITVGILDEGNEFKIAELTCNQMDLELLFSMVMQLE